MGKRRKQGDWKEPGGGSWWDRVCDWLTCLNCLDVGCCAIVSCGSVVGLGLLVVLALSLL